MLGNILKIIDRDGYISRPMLSRELGFPEEVVNDGITQLLRMGYISEEKTGEDCSSFCSGCQFAKNCSKEIVNFFKISDKGLGFLKGR